MAHREPATDCKVAAVHARLDQAAREIENLRFHLAWIDEDGGAHQASRSAAIVAGVTGQVADDLREFAAEQSAALAARVDLP